MSEHSLRYIDNGTFFTRIDALNKLLWVILVILVTFQLQTNEARALMLAFLLIVVALARIPLKSLWSALPIILIMGTLLFVVNLFTTPSTTFIEIGPLTLGQQGFERGL